MRIINYPPPYPPQGEEEEIFFLRIFLKETVFLAILKDYVPNYNA